MNFQPCDSKESLIPWTIISFAADKDDYLLTHCLLVSSAHNF